MLPDPELVFSYPDTAADRLVLAKVKGIPGMLTRTRYVSGLYFRPSWDADPHLFLSPFYRSWMSSSQVWAWIQFFATQTMRPLSICSY